MTGTTRIGPAELLCLARAGPEVWQQAVRGMAIAERNAMLGQLRVIARDTTMLAFYLGARCLADAGHDGALREANTAGRTLMMGGFNYLAFNDRE